LALKLWIPPTTNRSNDSVAPQRNLHMTEQEIKMAVIRILGKCVEFCLTLIGLALVDGFMAGGMKYFFGMSDRRAAIAAYVAIIYAAVAYWHLRRSLMKDLNQ
jgi:hypothetical protein